MLDSTIWIDREAREVFITALLMATPMEVTKKTPQLHVRSLRLTGWSVPPGWYGFIAAAGTGIVRRAGLTTETGLKALERLGAPERETRSRDYEGRRLVRIDGGYLVLNFMRYREHDYGAAQRMRLYRQRRKAQAEHAALQRNDSTLRRTVTRNDSTLRRTVTEAEAEAEAEAEKSKPKPSEAIASGGKPHWVRQCAQLWQNRYNGTPPWGQIGKLLAPVKDDPTLLKRLAAYFTATKPQFVDLAKFVQTFGSWGNGKTAPQTYSYEPGISGPKL